MEWTLPKNSTFTAEVNVVCTTRTPTSFFTFSAMGLNLFQFLVPSSIASPTERVERVERTEHAQHAQHAQHAFSRLQYVLRMNGRRENVPTAVLGES